MSGVPRVSHRGLRGRRFWKIGEDTWALRERKKRAIDDVLVWRDAVEVVAGVCMDEIGVWAACEVGVCEKGRGV